MASLNDLEIRLPQLPSEEEWMKAISELEGHEREAMILRAKGYNLLNDFNEPKASYERLGWLNLWSKNMTALESAIKAYQYDSDWILQTISRSTFEWWLHVMAIIEPVYDRIKSEESNHKIVNLDLYRGMNIKTIERLRAYAVWCLWNDRKYLYERVNPKTLEAAWDPNPAKDILSDEARLEEYETFYGRLKSEIDENILKQGKADQKRILNEKISRINRWLSDSQIEEWYKKILEISQNNKGTVTFFNLLDPIDTVIKRLKKYEIKFTYIEYIEGSMGLHGSTMEQFVSIDDSSVCPRLQMGNKADETRFNGIISECNQIFLLLRAIDHDILKNEKLRN